MLPTPVRADGDRSTPAYPRGNPTLAGAILPTPTARDHKGRMNTDPGRLRSGRPRTTGDDSLPDAVGRLLPTPVATDAESARRHTTTTGTSHTGTTLTDALVPLLPTPSASPAGTNRSPSPGAAVRPSLEQLVKGPMDQTPGASTPRPSRGGPPSSDDPPLLLWPDDDPDPTG
jgi:DNA (cytosine-5)-methyltransferase 1